MRSEGERIGKQGTTRALPFECVIDGQAPHSDSGHGRIAGQFLADAGWKIAHQEI